MTGPRPALSIQMGQQMTLTPQLLQSIRMLQLTTLELEMEMRAAMERNVMLEADEEDDAAGDAEPSEEPDSATEQVAVTGLDCAADRQLQPDFDWSTRESWSGGEPREDDEAIDARRAAPESTDIRVRALEQLRLVIDDPLLAQRAVAIVEHIDDNGYLELSLEQIRQHLPAELACTSAEMERVLALVQTVEPTGFGARDLRECLLLQLRMLPETPQRDLAELIICTCLERLGDGDMAEVAAALQLEGRDLAAAIDLVLSLDPKPGSTQAAAATVQIPEVIVSGSAGNWKVELNPDTLPRLRINRLYERALANHPHRALKEQLTEARWLIRGLEMRHDTLIRTATAIFERQQDFLRRGEEGMAPLTLREIAQAIGMHESTVCRITSNKYVLTPWGLYELKAFFPSQISGAAGDTSGTAVKAVIRRIIDTENRNSPLCDGEIAALLLRNGVRIARRTVAKYREAMHIAPAKERRPRRGSRAAVMALAGAST